MPKTPAWQRKAGQNPGGGLNAAGRASYKAQTGGTLKAPVKSGDNPRRASFLARMGGMPGPERDEKGRPTRLLLSLQATDPTERRLEAEKWCDAFEENTNKFLKSSVCSWKGQEPDLVFEDIDTRLMKPRPRLYGLVGGEVIEEVWKQRSRSKEESAPSKPAAAKQLAGSV